MGWKLVKDGKGRHVEGTDGTVVLKRAGEGYVTGYLDGLRDGLRGTPWVSSRRPDGSP